MHFNTLSALLASFCCGTFATTGKSFVANFDDIKGSGTIPELFPVKTPYKGLAFPGFNVYDTTEGITLLKAQSKPNLAASVTALQVVQGQAAMITTEGTSTKFFDLTSLFNGCLVASQTGLVAQGCTIEYIGVRTDGVVVSKTCVFSSLATKLAACDKFPTGFKGLKSVKVVPVRADLLPATTVVVIDTVSGSTYA